MPIQANPAFPVQTKAIPTDPNPVDDMPPNLYRFSGYNLPLNENGFYVVEFQDQSQPSDWSRRSIGSGYFADASSF